MDNYEDIIDSRDVIARIEELETEMADAYNEETREQPDTDELEFSF